MLRAETFQYLLVIVLREGQRILCREGHELAAGYAGIRRPGNERQRNDGRRGPDTVPIYLPGPLAPEVHVREERWCDKSKIRPCEDERQQRCSQCQQQRSA